MVWYRLNTNAHYPRFPMTVNGSFFSCILQLDSLHGRATEMLPSLLLLRMYLRMLILTYILYCNLYILRNSSLKNIDLKDYIVILCWYYVDIMLILCWYYVDIMLILCWYYVDIMLILCWYYVDIMLILCWYYVDIMLILCWYYVDIMLILCWYYVDIMLILCWYYVDIMLILCWYYVDIMLLDSTYCHQLRLSWKLSHLFHANIFVLSL